MESMKGNDFECFDERSDRHQYAKTVVALQGYCKKNLKLSRDLAGLFADSMTVSCILEPDEPGNNARTKLQEALWDEQVKTCANRIKTPRSKNLTGTHAVISHQYTSEDMKLKVKSITGYKDNAKSNNCLWLLHHGV